MHRYTPAVFAIAMSHLLCGSAVMPMKKVEHACGGDKQYATMGSTGSIHANLHSAIMIGCPKKVQSLIDEGADVHAQDGDGKRPLDLALSNQSYIATQALMSAGASLTALNGNKKTPLQSLTSSVARAWNWHSTAFELLEFMLGYEERLLSNERKSRGAEEADCALSIYTYAKNHVPREVIDKSKCIQAYNDGWLCAQHAIKHHDVLREVERLQAHLRRDKEMERSRDAMERKWGACEYYVVPIDKEGIRDMINSLVTAKKSQEVARRCGPPCPPPLD